jgi:hypothetical protein
MTLKPIREVFQNSFWRELQASHKAAQERAVQVNAVTANQDAAILHLSTANRKDYAANEKGFKDTGGYGEILRQRRR